MGFGAHSARVEIVALAEKLNAPIVSHLSRIGPSTHFDHPLVIGGLRLIGSKAGYEAIHSCDVLVMIGSDYPYTEFSSKSQKEIVQIDERAPAIGRRFARHSSGCGLESPRALLGCLNGCSQINDSFLRAAQKGWRSWVEMLDKRRILP